MKVKEAAENQEERAILWKILGTIIEVEKKNGNVDLARKLHGQTRAVVDDIASYTGEMRDVFLGQQAVIQLLSKN
jgi:hypothetical protein